MLAKGKRRREALAGLVLSILALAGGGTAAAQEPPGAYIVLYADASRTGFIDLYVGGTPGFDVEVVELEEGAEAPIQTFHLDGAATLWGAAQWRCDRRVRTFAALVKLGDGTEIARSTFDVLTPSCRDRLSLRVPGTVAKGARLRAEVEDRWGIGGIRSKVCAVHPGVPRRCAPVALGLGVARETGALKLGRKGRWTVELHSPGQLVKRTVYVGGGYPFLLRGQTKRPSILLTGDSMMMSLDNVLIDRLDDRALVRSEVKAGTGLAKPGFDWIKNARRQVRRLNPDATVVFMGANDLYGMTTAAGEQVVCCGGPWIEEYTRRVRQMMSAYRRGGFSHVIWITLPAPRIHSVIGPYAAINAAARQAAASTPGVRLLEFDFFFTPGFRFREYMRYRGRRLQVRAKDGVHLSIEGAAVGAALVRRALRELELF